MNLFIEEELERSLSSAGLHELPSASRSWVYAKLATAGLRVGYAPSYVNAFDALLGEQEKRRALARVTHGSFDLATPEPVSYEVDTPGDVLQAAHMLVETSRRLGRPRPLEAVGDWTDYLPIYSYFSPPSEATKKYIELRADWLALQEQAGPGGVEQYPDLKTDVDEFTKFRTEWEAGTIKNSDIAGRLNAEVVRVNRVRATLLEHQSGKTVFVQDLPDPTKNIDTVTATPGGDAAQAVDDWAKKSPFLDALTNPAGPAIKLPGFPKLPGGIFGGLAIIGGTLLVANQVLGALVRKAVGA